MTIMEQGGFELLKQIAAAHLHNPTVQKNICGAMFSLASNDANKVYGPNWCDIFFVLCDDCVFLALHQVTIMEQGGFELLKQIAAVHLDHATVQENICGTVMSLAMVDAYAVRRSDWFVLYFCVM